MQAGLPQSCPRASLWWFWKLSLALLPGPHILGESRSPLDPNLCGQVEIFFVQQWGVSLPRQVPWEPWVESVRK